MTDMERTGLPIPDPTVLTTEQLLREIASVRDHIDGQLQVRDERLAGIDRATELRLSGIEAIPGQIQDAVDHLASLVDERFGSIQTQFLERDTRSERECLSADEPVLCADLIWRPAGELEVGDELVAFDEEPQVGRKGRCYRRAVVTANSLRPDQLLQVNTSRGSVRCNAQHPWLVRDRSDRCWKWVEAQDLRPNSQVMSVLDVWQVDRSYEAGWLAGILDGEGYLHSKNQKQYGGTRIVVAQVIGPLAEEIDRALAGFAPNRLTKRAVGNARAQYRWQIGSRPEVMRLLGSVRPKRLMEHSDDVWEGRALFGTKRSTVATVESVMAVGMGTIAMLSTSTGTYIGAGFAHHNSRDNKVAVDAAFAAQKEAAAKQDEANAKAIDKSEKATTETIKTNQELSRATTDALTKSLDEVKLAVSRIESTKVGSSAGIAGIVTIVGFLLTAMIVGIALYAALRA